MATSKQVVRSTPAEVTRGAHEDAFRRQWSLSRFRLDRERMQEFLLGGRSRLRPRWGLRRFGAVKETQCEATCLLNADPLLNVALQQHSIAVLKDEIELGVFGPALLKWLGDELILPKEAARCGLDLRKKRSNIGIREPEQVSNISFR